MNNVATATKIKDNNNITNNQTSTNQGTVPSQQHNILTSIESITDNNKKRSTILSRLKNIDEQINTTHAQLICLVNQKTAAQALLDKL